MGLKGSILFLEIIYLFFIFGGAAKLRWEGAQRPFWRVNESKKRGARSARARTQGQNPLVYHIFTYGPLSVFRPVIFLSSCHIPVIFAER